MQHLGFDCSVPNTLLTKTKTRPHYQQEDDKTVEALRHFTSKRWNQPDFMCMFVCVCVREGERESILWDVLSASRLLCLLCRRLLMQGDPVSFSVA